MNLSISGRRFGYHIPTTKKLAGCRKRFPMKGYYGGIIPEAEVRQLHRIGEDGRVGEFLGHGYALA